MPPSLHSCFTKSMISCGVYIYTGCQISCLHSFILYTHFHSLSMSSIHFQEMLLWLDLDRAFLHWLSLQQCQTVSQSVVCRLHPYNTDSYSSHKVVQSTVTTISHYMRLLVSKQWSVNVLANWKDSVDSHCLIGAWEAVHSENWFLTDFKHKQFVWVSAGIRFIGKSRLHLHMCNTA